MTHLGAKWGGGPEEPQILPSLSLGSPQQGSPKRGPGCESTASPGHLGPFPRPALSSVPQGLLVLGSRLCTSYPLSTCTSGLCLAVADPSSCSSPELSLIRLQDAEGREWGGRAEGWPGMGGEGFVPSPRPSLWDCCCQPLLKVQTHLRSPAGKHTGS